MNVPKRNHYIPKKFSKAWSDDGRRVFQLDKIEDSPTPKLIGLSDAGVQRFFYAPELENIFGKHVENPAWPVLDKIRAHEPVVYSEVGVLLSYTAAQYARTPKMLSFLRDLSNNIVNDTTNKYRALGIDLPNEGFDADRLHEMCECFFPMAQLGLDPSRDYSDNLPLLARQLQSNAERLLLPNLRWMFHWMEWSVQQLGPFGEFILSDSPVSGWRERDQTIIGAISFPLSPKLLLSGRLRNGSRSKASSLSKRRPLKIARINESVAYDFNRRLADDAERFIWHPKGLSMSLFGIATGLTRSVVRRVAHR